MKVLINIAENEQLVINTSKPYRNLLRQLRRYENTPYINVSSHGSSEPENKKVPRSFYESLTNKVELVNAGSYISFSRFSTSITIDVSLNLIENKIDFFKDKIFIQLDNNSNILIPFNEFIPLISMTCTPRINTLLGKEIKEYTFHGNRLNPWDFETNEVYAELAVTRYVYNKANSIDEIDILIITYTGIRNEPRNVRLRRKINDKQWHWKDNNSITHRQFN